MDKICKEHYIIDCKECAENETTGNKSASVTGLGADADYAYKDIEEFEAIIECKVNDTFKDGWKMARTTNKQLRALAGEEAGP